MRNPVQDSSPFLIREASWFPADSLLAQRHVRSIFAAVEVRAGKHRVEFLYRPRLFHAGLSVSSVTCLAIALGAVAVFRGRDVVRVDDEAESDDRR